MENHILLDSITVVYCGAALFATLVLLTRQALPVAYFVLGAVIGPGGAGLIPHAELVDDIAQFGIVFLLFLLGLELQPKKLLNLFRTVFIPTTTSFLAFAVLGFAVTLAFGFSAMEAFVAAIASGFSSTIIGINLLPTTTLHHRHIGTLVIGILLLQDTLAIIALVVVHNLGAAEVIDFKSFVPILLLPVFVAVLFVLERYVIRKLIWKFEQIREYIFLLMIAWCLGCAELAALIGLSIEIGAFTGGVIMASSPIALYLAERLHPIRDFFLVLFFVAIGAHFKFATAGNILLPALVLATLFLIIKPMVFKFVLVRSAEKVQTAKEAGQRLGQLSEFSLLLVFIALQSGIVSQALVDYILLATVLTFLGSSYLVVHRYPTPVALSDRLRRN